MVRPGTSETGRYGRLVAAAYDVVSLERPLYAAPRRRLLSLLDLAPGATVVDVGCGTGLDLPALVAAVGPGGRVVGVDASPQMLARAARRVRRAGWGGVTLLQGDGGALPDVLRRAGVGLGEVDAVVAAYVLSVLGDDGRFWDGVDAVLTARAQVRVAVADFGPADRAPGPVRGLYGALVAAGGARADRAPWQGLLDRAVDAVHEEHLSGHVHLVVGTCGPAG